MADFDLSRRALLARAAIVAPLALAVGAVGLPALAPATTAWDAALHRYQASRAAIELVADDEAAFDRAVDTNFEHFTALMMVPAPNLAAAVQKARIARFEDALSENAALIFADFDKFVPA